MSNLDKAIELDIQQKIVEAADLYEEVLKDGNAPLEAYLNLACLYWESMETGFSGAMKLSPEFQGRAFHRMYRVFDEAKEMYGDIPEAEFWKLYIDFIDYGGEPFPDKALELVQQPNASLVPYFHILFSYGEEKYREKVRQLVAEAKKSLTTKNRYIISITESLVE